MFYLQSIQPPWIYIFGMYSCKNIFLILLLQYVVHVVEYDEHIQVVASCNEIYVILVH